VPSKEPKRTAKGGLVAPFEDDDIFGVMGEMRLDDDEAWLQVHDVLLDRWLELYEATPVRATPGMRAIYPVQVTSQGLICLHDCPCMKNAEWMWGTAANGQPIPGSRHKDWRLVLSCEQCMRDSGWAPREEAVPKYDA